MTTPASVRPREDDDLPALAALLAEQQPTSSYPLRWPLPFPVEEFLVRRGERASWVAHDETGAILGHVSVLGSGEDEVGRAFRAILGRTDLAVVAVLFTALAARRRGVGRLLLDTAVAWARRERLLPVLDVVPDHGAAVGLYRDQGWTEVGTLRPAWLAASQPDVLVMALLDQQ